MPLRRVPHALMHKVKQELERMEKNKIIKPTTHPTDWVSQMVVVMKKDGSLRICMDPRPLNKATKRAHYPFPTFEEISAELHGAKYFCKLDAQSGYWMLPLDSESSKLCTFQTPWGRYSFLRLPFGLNISAEIFHKTIAETFGHIKKVRVFQDDILVFADSQEELKQMLMEVLTTAANRGIKFNPKKCEFNVNKVKFLGHTFDSDGITIDPDKVKAITQLKTPSDKKALQRLLGMCNYVSRFIPHYSSISAPLRELLKNDIEFSWNEVHSRALHGLKRSLTESPVLGFFDPGKELTLSVDASSKGLGAVLIQEGKPLAYASRALTEVQMRYSQIEKELLAVCFGTEKFRQYILGQDYVRVETDHKPLLGVFQKPLWKVPVRLQRMLMRLQIYRLKLIHTPGKYLYVADTLSRDFDNLSCDTETNFDDDTELQIAMLVENLPVTKECWILLEKETQTDPVLKKIIEYIVNGWPKHYKDVEEVCKPFFEFKDELSEVKGLVLRGEKIVIPNCLINSMLKKLHTGHPGINRMQNRAEKTVFWLGINQDIKKFVQSCSVCLRFHSNKVKLPLAYKKIPDLPWMDVACDLFEFNQKYHLIVSDALSNYVETAPLSNMRSETVIETIKSIFARHGIPVTFYTDGGPCFDSEQFKKFARDWNFSHVMSSPHYPKSNGQAESAVKAIKKIFKKCEYTGEDKYLALLHYRNTPRGQVHSPASNLMSKSLRTNIPCTYSQLIPKVTYDQDRKLLTDQKEKTKMFYDRSARNRDSLSIGQNIMFKKLPNSIWIPGTIIAKGTGPRSYVVEGGGNGEYTRNEIHIRPRPSPTDSNTLKNTQTQNSPLIPPTQSQTVKLIPSSQLQNIQPARPINLPTPLTSPLATRLSSSQNQYSTRSGRIVRRPAKLDN